MGGNCCQMGDPYGMDQNSVLVMQQGCCGPNFSETITDPRLAALITAEEYRASISKINNQINRAMLCAFGLFFGFLVAGWAVGGAFLAQYIPPSYTCLEPNGECVISEFQVQIPAFDSCCRWWCCEDGNVAHQWGPTEDKGPFFTSQACELIDSVRGADTNCNCWEVKRSKKTEKYCFSTKMEGEYERDPGRAWPRVVGLVVGIPFTIAGILLNVFCICKQSGIIQAELDQYRARGVGHNYIMGTKHRRAAIVFRLPMAALPTAQPVGAPGQPPAPYGAQPAPYCAQPGQPVPYPAQPGQAPVAYGYAQPAGAPPGGSAYPAAPYQAYQQPAASGPDPAMGYNSGVDGVTKY